MRVIGRVQGDVVPATDELFGQDGYHSFRATVAGRWNALERWGSLRNAKSFHHTGSICSATRTQEACPTARRATRCELFHVSSNEVFETAYFGKLYHRGRRSPSWGTQPMRYIVDKIPAAAG